MSAEVFADEPSPDEEEQLINALRVELCRNATYKTLHGTVERCLYERLIPAPLASKVRDLNTSHEVAQCSNVGEHTLFGLPLQTEPPLSYHDGQTLRIAVVEAIVTADNRLTQDARITPLPAGNHEGVSSFETLDGEVREGATLGSGRDLREVLNVYRDGIQTHVRLLGELVGLRQGNLADVAENKVIETKRRGTLADRKLAILGEKVGASLFSESAVALEAFGTIAADTARRQTLCLKEIGRLKEKKEKYRIVGCKEYDEILKQYLLYSGSLKRLEELHQNLRRKE